jgi:hypothetical protein
MNRLNPSKETLQKLHSARLSLETSIRETKTLMHQPGGNSEAQSRLSLLRREATLLYTALAACRGRLHCKTSEERLEALQRKASSEVMLKYLTPVEALVLELLKTPAPTPAPAQVVSAAVAA